MRREWQKATMMLAGSIVKGRTGKQQRVRTKPGSCGKCGEWCTKEAREFENLNALSPDIDARYWDSEELKAGRVVHAVSNAEVRVFFGMHILSALLEAINAADAVVGCVAWFTHPEVLDALSKKKTAIVVQKEDFLRPDTKSSIVNSISLRKAYEKLGGLERCEFPRLIEMSSCAEQGIEGVRCMGVREKERLAPRMHHKFLVLCRHEDRPIGSDVQRTIFPFAVWTGSFNMTVNAVHSVENAVLVFNEKIAEAFLAEFEWIAGLSEPLDWTCKYVEPEWRFGS